MMLVCLHVSFVLPEVTSSVAAFHSVLGQGYGPVVWGVISLPVKDTARLFGGIIKTESDYKEVFFK